MLISILFHLFIIPWDMFFCPSENNFTKRQVFSNRAYEV